MRYSLWLRMFYTTSVVAGYVVGVCAAPSHTERTAHRREGQEARGFADLART